MTALATYIEQLLQNTTDMSATLDPSLNTPVSKSLVQQLTSIREMGLSLRSAKDLVFKQTQFASLMKEIINLLRVTGEEFSSTNGNGLVLSPEQNNFLQQLIEVTVETQTYLQLLVRVDVINRLYDQLSNISLLSSAQIQDIDSLLSRNAVEQTQNFITSVTAFSDTTFADVKSLDDMITRIQSALKVLKYFGQAYLFIMFTGPPGTGKTTLARAIANYYSDGVYFNLDMSALLGQYVGEVEKRITELFRYVSTNRQKKFTIVIDELDIVLGENADNAPYLTTLRNTFQTALDSNLLGPNVVVVGMTNYYNKLSSVIRRRTTNIFYVDLPSLAVAVDYLLDQIYAPFRLVVRNESPQQVVASSYRESVLRYFSDIPNRVFSLANMKNIARVAVESVMTNETVYVYNYPVDGQILKVVTSNLDCVANGNNFEVVSTNVFFNDMQQEGIVQKIFCIPSLEDYMSGYTQTPAMTVEEFNVYRLNNDPAANNLIATTDESYA